MKGAARRLVRLSPAAGRSVAVAGGIGVVTAVLVVVQAGLLADLVARAFLGGAGIAQVTPALLALGGVVAARAVLGWAGEVAAQRRGSLVVTEVRKLLLGRVLLLGPRHPGLPSTGRLTALAGRGVDALDEYAGRYLPQCIVATVVPGIVWLRILSVDWPSALLLAVTVPLVPVFMVLIGLHTRQRVARQWRTLTVLAGHFLDVVAGLDVLTAFGRARGQAAWIAAVSERHRAETMRTLRVGFLSSLTLELLASLSVALVAVSVGLRLVAGDLGPCHRPAGDHARRRSSSCRFARWPPATMTAPRAPLRPTQVLGVLDLPRRPPVPVASPTRAPDRCGSRPSRSVVAAAPSSRACR